MTKKNWIACAIVALMFGGMGAYVGLGKEKAKEAGPQTATIAPGATGSVNELYALTLPDAAGATQALSQWKGKNLLVNFWATWCEPCREEMPSLQRLQQKLGGKGLRVLAVNVGEGAPRIRQFLERTPVALTILRDADSEAMKAWRVRMLPASFLVDRRGMLRYQLIGEADYDDPKQQAPILELLK